MIEGLPYLADHNSPLVSWILVGVVGLLFVAATAFVIVCKLELRAAEARKQSLPDESEPRLGRCTLRGIVTAVPNEAPILIDVLQKPDGKEGHRFWIEQSRSVERSAPFSLAIAGGRAVRVDPGGEIELIVEPREFVPRSDGERICRLEMLPGTEVSVSGQIERAEGQAAYRSEGPGFVLRPVAGEPLWISSKPFRERRLGVARHLDVPLFVFALVIVQAMFFGRFYVLSADGAVSEATVTGVTRTNAGKDRELASYELSAIVVAQGAQHEVKGATTEAIYLRREAVPPVHVPVIVSQRFPRVNQLGPTPSVSAWTLWSVPLLVVILVVTLVRMSQHSFRDRLVHVERTGRR